MTNRHLCIGINSYAGAPLSGCLNDARDWDALLTERGSQGRLLLESEATKSGMLAAITDVLKSASRGDYVVITNSTHGSWQPDDDGDEADGRDEGIVPFDYETAGLLLDDDLHRTIGNYARIGTKTLMIADSCHSGTVSRAFGHNDAATGVGRPRYLPPQYILSEQKLKAARKVEAAEPKGVSRPSAALLAACSDVQVAWDADFGGRPNGAFTRAAIGALQSDSPKNLTAWLTAIRQGIGYDQTPQLQGTWYQRRRWRVL